MTTGSRSAERPLVSVAIVGGGPTGTAFLERLIANAGQFISDANIEIHLIDPYPPGGGRVWRHEQSPLMWMNSMAEDVTMFTDETVRCAGPIVPGPSLDEWAATVGEGELSDADVVREVRALHGMTFPSRRLQSAYLAWVIDRVIGQAPNNIRITRHQTLAVDITDERAEGAAPGGAGRQVVHLLDEPSVIVDAVVLALGHLDVEPTPEHRVSARFAEQHGLFFIPPDYTADIDLDRIEPNERVIVRGFGVAFVDLMVLLTEERGGRYIDGADGLRYEPSGHEPIIYVGSRRGVPYRSKIEYRLQGRRPPTPRFFDNEAIATLLATQQRIDFRTHVWPLLSKDAIWAYYFELFRNHPDRTTMSWSEFDERFSVLRIDDPQVDELVAAAVPGDADRFDIARLDHPLTNAHFDTFEELQHALREHITADRARRADPMFSADLGAFYGLLVGFGQLVQVSGSGQVIPRSLIEDINGWWMGFFSYYASGPPGPRLDQMVALSKAGVLRFVGADMWVEADEQLGVFRAGSASSDHVVSATTLVEARLPQASISRTQSPLLSSMRDRREISEQLLTDLVEGIVVNTGKLQVAPDLRILDADGQSHERRFALGIHTSRPAAGTFARPRTNALSFRQNDAAARDLLELLAAEIGGDASNGLEADLDVA